MKAPAIPTNAQVMSERFDAPRRDNQVRAYRLKPSPTMMPIARIMTRFRIAMLPMAIDLSLHQMQAEMNNAYVWYLARQSARNASGAPFKPLKTDRIIDEAVYDVK